jgi:uncharacterized protein YbbK (DUF523 family)
MKIVSACLAGINCGFDQGAYPVEKVKELVRHGEAIPVCPEQLGGLSTPREKHEIKGSRVISESGKDRTKEFQKGAEEALKIALLCRCDEAVLKERSPSCGCRKVYDGSFSGRLVKGEGFFAKLLRENNIKVKSHEEI